MSSLSAVPEGPRRAWLQEKGAKAAVAISLLAGGGDLATGVCLLLAPERTLSRMGVAPAGDLAWTQFVGVFVAAVGASYFYGLFCWRVARRAGSLRTVWELTALLRAAVCCFVSVEIASGGMDRAWSSVSLTDGFWALLQFVLLRRRFPNDA
ncbi:hypothetical protein [Methylacidimicrobium sp. B4]|uniref:hypothetical protein n=1 Tax=Methylacidimicrobium sp. B4 TaxID=2796139 RepID=UPI001A8D3C36|nr:hypothetical protein [Methylacidimicrobium sp. B4]QSR85582.1 hypothetical protein MacB4_05005 [Methylacidimicrobium sp. B4]